MDQFAATIGEDAYTVGASHDVNDTTIDLVDQPTQSLALPRHRRRATAFMVHGPTGEVEITRAATLSETGIGGIQRRPVRADARQSAWPPRSLPATPFPLGNSW